MSTHAVPQLVAVIDDEGEGLCAFRAAINSQDALEGRYA
jgi:hypothetical protein